MSGRSPYIVSPTYDWAWFLLPPSVALWLGFMIADTGFTATVFTLWGNETTVAELCLGALIHAHLVAVVFRSHLNRDVFRTFPLRFVVVPVVVWLAILSSTWAAVTATVVATFWDVYHSGAQTFGFARIYDRNVGSALEITRTLDKWMNQLLYVGPILAGVTLADHVEVFDNFEAVGSALLVSIPARVEGAQRYLAVAVVAAGTALTAIYVLVHLRLHRRGHKVSPLKLFIVSSTGLCSIWSWGFNSWGEAFFTMNAFHAVQYLALVWATEGGRLMTAARGARRPRGKAIAAAVFFGAVGVYGFAAQAASSDLLGFWALTMVVSLMHFWYDGFVWSVRRQQI